MDLPNPGFSVRGFPVSTHPANSSTATNAMNNGKIGPGSDKQPLPGLDRDDIRWNYIAHAIEGGLYIGGLSFVAANSVLPRIVEILGGPAWVISLTPILTMLGFNLLPVFNAHRIEMLERVKPVLLLTGIFQRIPYLFAGLAIYFLGVKHPHAALWFVVLVPLLSGLFGGLISTAWQELVAKTVPNRRRASVFALRNIISSMIGITAGGIIAAVLNWMPGIRGYGLLHLITFVFLALSYVVFVHIREGSYTRQTAGAALSRSFRPVITSLRGCAGGIPAAAASTVGPAGSGRETDELRGLRAGGSNCTGEPGRTCQAAVKRHRPPGRRTYRNSHGGTGRQEPCADRQPLPGPQVDAFRA